MQLLSWYLDLGKPVVALQAPPPDRGRTPCLRPNSKGSSRWAAGRHDPGVTEPALPALALDRLEAVVFDTDGVLTDTASVHAAPWKRLFDEYLQLRATRDGEPFRPFTEADYLRSVDGRPRYDGVAGFLASRGITLPWGDPSDPPDRETVCGLGNRKNRWFLAQVQEHGVRAFPGSVAFVRELRARAVRTAVVSASRNMRAVLDAAGIRG